jgi:hypothetical protein
LGGGLTMDELFYKWFNDYKEKLQKMGIQTDLISKSKYFVDHLTSLRIGRVTVWKSGFIEMEILDIQSSEQIFYKNEIRVVCY